MKEVTIYTKPGCGYCHAARRLLGAKGIAFREIDVARDAMLYREMTDRSNGGRTVPQIFIGDRHIGGFDEMNALDRMGKLDPLLAA
jgi:glutaredoxin 3